MNAVRGPDDLLRDPGHLLALGFGAGCVPALPGTAGTVMGVLLYLPCQSLPILAYLAIVLLAFGAGVWLCGRTASRLGTHDHPAIVWDEICGFFATMIAAPHGWIWIAAGFLLFRLFDIWKPWPVRILDRSLKGGFGIMADDLAAAAYAGICLQTIAYQLRS